MAQWKRKIGVEEAYAGHCGWPVYEYKCPDCNCWSREGSDITQEIDGEQVMLCTKCADEVIAETPEFQR